MRNALNIRNFSTRLLLLAVGISLHFSLQAQDTLFSPTLIEAHQALLELRHDRLREIITTEKLAHPRHPIAHYLESSALIIELILNKSESRYESAQEQLNKTQEFLAALPPHNPLSDHLRSEFAMSLSLLHFMYDKPLRAGVKILRAHKLLQNNYENFPDFAPSQLLTGIFYAEVGSLPGSYQKVAGLFGFKADVKKGFKLMRNGYRQLQNEPRYSFLLLQYGMLYSYINFMLTGSDSISPRKLGLPYHSSALTLFVQAEMDLNHGQREQAFALLQKIPRSAGYRNYPFFDYHTGKTGMPLNPSQARPYFERFLNNTQNKNFITSSYRYLSWHYVAQGQMDSARIMQKAAMEKGIRQTDEDKQAFAELQRPLNPCLIKAHLQFDAGRYGKALNTLNQLPYESAYPSALEKTEFHYRAGRSLQKLNQKERAIFHFKSALKNSPDNYLMTANSALQVGLLYKTINRNQAQHYLEQCLRMSDYPFEASVKQRAKTELEKL